MSDEQAVRAATEAFYGALNSMLAGDPEPFAALWSHSDDTAYMPAEGGILAGWGDVYADWVKQAQASRGGTVTAEDVSVVVGDDLATSWAYSSGKVSTPDGGTQEIRIRESSVFRKEGGEWKMIAHHADDFTLWEDVVRSG